MPIPLLDFKEQYAQIKDEVLRVTAEVYESQAFILGKRVEAFEKDFAGYSHATYAVGVSSGTDALLIALMILDLKPGDEVIVPAYSFFATAGVAERVGAIPVFVDVDEDSLNLSATEFEKKITSRTRAVIPVHLYGQCADMDAINEIARRHDIVVIEDAAQAVGAEYKGVRAGALAPLAAFSFYPTKNLGAFGDAGAVTTSDETFNTRLLDYRVHGMRPKYFHKYVGGNFRIDALQAAILHVKMRYLEEWTRGRQENAAIYERLFTDRKLTDRVTLPVALADRRHVYNQYVIRFHGGSATRERVMATLKEHGIGSEIYYPLTLPDQECFRALPSSSESYPVSRAAADSSLAIPIFPELKPAQLEEVVDTIAKALS